MEPEINESASGPSAFRRRERALSLVAVVIGLGVALAIAALAYQRWRAEPVPAPVVDAGSPEPVDAGSVEAVRVEDADAMVAAASPSLTADPDVARWLAEPGMLRRLVAAVWQVSEAESPREALLFFAPRGPYAVISRDGHFYQSAESEARYDFVARALASVNTQKLGGEARRLSAFVDAVFREISPPGRRFTYALDAAIERLAAVPLTDGPLEVVPADAGITYRFADPRLEALDPTQKHLLRMGAANARVVIQKLREFREALAVN